MKKLKNLICIVLSCIILIAFASCSTTLKLDGHDWNFEYLQQKSNAQIIACGELKKEFFNDVEVREFNVEINKNSLTILNDTNSWNVSFEKISEKPNDIIYQGEVVIDGITKQVMVGLGITTYHNDKQEYTLLISTDNYTICFFEEK